MASALKTSAMTPPELLGGEGTEYASRYQEAVDAENALMELLKSRREEKTGGGFRLDPSMLALAGELLDPGRTGSFFEGVGRGAKAYATTQEAERKRDIEDAMMQMQMAQIPLDRARRSQALKQFKEMQGGVTPEGGVGPVEGDKSGPAMMVKGRMVTPAMIAQMKLIDKDLADAMELEYKLRLESIGSQPSGTYNKLTGEFKPFPGREMAKEYVPELKGDIAMAPEDIIAIRAARESGDKKTVYGIIDRYSQGVGPRGEPGAAGAAAEPPSDITVSGREAKSAAEKTKAETMAKESAESTTKFLNLADEHRTSRAAAAQNLEIVTRNPKIFGYLNKPGVGNALWSLVQDAMTGHAKAGTSGVDVQVSKADIVKTLQKVDPKFKIEDFTDLDIFIGNLARMELGLRRQTYAGSGMGSVSNLEGQPIKDVLGSKYDTPKAIQQKMALAARGFDYDMDIAAAYREYRNKAGNRYKTLEDFKGDSEDGTYKRLTNGLESWLNKNLGIPYRKRDTGQPTTDITPVPSGSAPTEPKPASAAKDRRPSRPLNTQSVEDAIRKKREQGLIK